MSWQMREAPISLAIFGEQLDQELVRLYRALASIYMRQKCEQMGVTAILIAASAAIGIGECFCDFHRRLCSDSHRWQKLFEACAHRHASLAQSANGIAGESCDQDRRMCSDEHRWEPRWRRWPSDREIVASISLQSWVILEQRCVADDARLRFTSQMVQRLVSLNASALCIAG